SLASSKSNGFSVYDIFENGRYDPKFWRRCAKDIAVRLLERRTRVTISVEVHGCPQPPELIARLEPQDQLIIVMRYADGRTGAGTAPLPCPHANAAHPPSDHLLHPP